MRERDTRDSSSGSVAYLVMAGTLFVASSGLIGGYYLVDTKPERTVPTVSESDDRGVEVEAVRAATQTLLDTPVAIQIGDGTTTVTWNQLGLVIDDEGLESAAEMASRSDVTGSLTKAAAMPVNVDRAQAVAQLQSLADEYRQSPVDARMDLEARKIHPSRSGRTLDILGSLGRLEVAARSGVSEIDMAVVQVPAEITVDDLGIDDISHVLATFSTNYKTSDSSRNDNLKLAASKLNGYVMQPGVEFSFNEVVGARSEEEGYKIAHVITSGEMVDGLAGGTCQISTTLHGAAFFSGLGIERAIPHSRPSTYATMGLDATVVYPQVDMKLKNNYDFPVVIHFKVTRGKSIVEILGKERPYDKIVYEREIQEQLEFDTVTREDDTMPLGSMKVDQYGFFGYKVAKIRKYYKNGKQVDKDRWSIRYRPVTEYVRTGTNPDPNLPQPKVKKKGKRLKEPGKGTFRMEQ